MFLTYVFFGIFLIFAVMFILCDGKRSSTTVSVMVAPEHLRFCDHMSCPLLGDIHNTQPPLLADLTAASRWSVWHRYRQFPSPPKSPAHIYEVSLKFALLCP